VEHKEMLLSIAEQLMDIGIAIEKMAKAESTLRTEPTMPTPAESMDRELLLGQQTPDGELIDPLGMLKRLGIENPLWDLDADAASDLLGVPKNTVGYLAERFALPHAMTTEGGRGPGGRRRVYSGSVCVAYMTQCYTLDALPCFGVKLLTAHEAGKVLETTAQTVGKWAKAGSLPCITYGHRRYFFPSDVTASTASEGASNVSG